MRTGEHVEDGYQPLQAVPLRQQVYDRLESLILDGRLKSGERLVESELAARLGISRGPIREALQHLERDGWLEVRPRQGTYVRAPREDELQDYYGVRRLLEIEAVERASARARTDPAAVREGLDELRKMLATAKDLASGLPASTETELTPEQAERRNAYRKLSRNFHYSIAKLSGSRAIEDVLEYLTKRTRWYSSFAYSDRLHEHGEIVEAIAAGDEKLAVSLMLRHMESMSIVAVQTLRESSTVAPD
jgi:DNA-binding GntR family transcriptional regulator